MMLCTDSDDDGDDDDDNGDGLQKGCWQTLPMMVCTDVENERPERVTVSKDYQSLK